MKIEFKENIIKKLGKGYAQILPQWQEAKENGITLREFIENDCVETFHVSLGEAGAIAKDITEGCSEFYSKLAEANASDLSPQNYLRSKLSETMQDMSKSQQYEFLSFIRRISMRTSLNCFGEDLKSEGYDTEFIKEIIEEEHRANNEVANMEPTNSEIEELTAEAFEAMDESILFVKPEFMADTLSQMYEERDVTNLAQDVSEKISQDNEYQTLCSYIAYKAIRNGEMNIEGVSMDNLDARIVSYYISAGCAYEQAFRDAKSNHGNDEIRGKILSTISTVAAFCVLAYVGFRVISGVLAIAIALHAPLIFSGSLIISVLGSILMSLFLIGAGDMLFKAGVWAVKFIISKEFRVQVKESFIRCTANVIGWVRNKAIPTVKRKCKAMAAWVQDKWSKIKAFFKNVKERISEMWEDSASELISYEDLDEYVHQNA